MKRVAGYVHRHLAQKSEDVEHSRWRYPLMNWVTTLLDLAPGRVPRFGRLRSAAVVWVVLPTATHPVERLRPDGFS